MKALIQIDPKKAKEEITSAFAKARCHYQEAGVVLGTTAQTFRRWARDLGIKEKLEAMEEKAKREGWHHGRVGGAGFHKDPKTRVEKAKRTRALNAKTKARVKKKAAAG